MFTSLLFTIPKKAPLFIFSCLLFLFAIGCGPQPQPIASTQSPAPFYYTIRIEQKGSNNPIEEVHVTLEVSGRMPIDGYTDSNGIAVLKVEANQAGRLGRLIAEKGNYRYTENLTIQEDLLPDRLLFDDRGTFTAINDAPTAVFTNTPVPTQAQPTDTAVPPVNTIQPTATATPQPTNTPSPTATNTPPPTGQIIAKVTETAHDTWVYAGPGDANLRLGSMQINETGVVLGKDKWNGWYKVRTSSNIEGWVDISHLTLTEGSPGDVAVIWPSADDNTGSNSTTSTNLPTGGGSSSQCAVVTLDFREWPNETFDDITVSWSNVPASTAYFIFAANGTLNGEEAPLIYPTQVNVDEEYFIGLWKFAERGFTSGGTFSYALQAKTNSGTTICTTTGTFTQ